LLAKMIGDIATGQTPDSETDTRNQVALELGQLGEKQGGQARADKLTAKQRREIAQKGRKSADTKETDALSRSC
jgi:hypothetical protein